MAEGEERKSSGWFPWKWFGYNDESENYGDDYWNTSKNENSQFWEKQKKENSQFWKDMKRERERGRKRI